jgi:PAS domain S-box-containing protein
MLGIPDFANVFLSEMPDGVLVADDKGVIRMWNAGCERIFGFTAEEAIGQSLDIIIPENLRARHWEGYQRTMRTGETRYGAGDLLNVPALRKDGTRISIEFSILPFRNAEGRIVGIGAVMRDVTKKFEETKALKKALAAAGAGLIQQPAEQRHVAGS